jgi:hypothetical protein
MKHLGPIWFLEPPLDYEHKNYILLDYLKNRSENLEPEAIIESLKSISYIVRNLNSFKTNSCLPDDTLRALNESDREVYRDVKDPNNQDPALSEIDRIVDNSLDLLYSFSEVCMKIVEEEQEKIKIFRLGTRFDKKINQKRSGILLVRNMITDEITSYYWKETKVESEASEKEVIVMKKINLANKYFSISYEYLYHEVLLEISSDKGYSPILYVTEIYEDFGNKSPILKIAKERFVQVLAQEQN